MKTKKFDAVAMKHRGAEAILAAIAHMTLEEQLAYWAKRTQALQERQEAARHALADADEQEKRMTITERLARAGYADGSVFKTGEEVAAYIREERESWER